VALRFPETFPFVGVTFLSALAAATAGGDDATKGVGVMAGVADLAGGRVAGVVAEVAMVPR